MKKYVALAAGIILLLGACQPLSDPVPTDSNIETKEPLLLESLEAETQVDGTLPDDTETSLPTETPARNPIDFKPHIELKLIADQLTAPVDLDAPNDGTGRLFVTDQIGLIYVLGAEDNFGKTTFLDISNKLVNLNPNYDERGLLGMAFHPDYANNGRFFVYYSAPLRPEAPPGYDHTSILSEFRVSEADSNQADPGSEKIILQVHQPQSNHNAGAIAFSPADGYLYIPLGDGGSGDDRGSGHAEDWYEVNAGGNGQDIEDNLLGSILRIDVDNGDPYAIPEDNPKISMNYPEIWAYGFRNPYRMAFDPGGEHELFLGDAGQELWEEVSIVKAGGNYGWNIREGTHCFSTANPGNPQAITDCPTTDPEGDPLIDPIIEFPNTKHPEGGLGSSIIGGVVYRGSSLPAWDGRYIFGQWSVSAASPQGGLFIATRGDDDLWQFQDIEILNREGPGLGEYLLALGNDQEGEVYVLTSLKIGPSGKTGSVYRIMPPSDSKPEAPE